MGASFLIWFGVMAVVGVIAWLVLSFAAMARPGAAGGPLAVAEGPSVRYRVPDGEDPVALAESLIDHGYHARTDAHGGTGQRDLVVPLAHGESDRESIRALIAEAEPSMDGPAPGRREVRFLDEIGE